MAKGIGAAVMCREDIEVVNTGNHFRKGINYLYFKEEKQEEIIYYIIDRDHAPFQASASIFERHFQPVN